MMDDARARVILAFRMKDRLERLGFLGGFTFLTGEGKGEGTRT